MHFPVAYGEATKTISDKVLMVDHWRIDGSVSNAGTRSVNGSQVDSSQWVLRSIIAV